MTKLLDCHLGKNKFAYVFYATDNNYAVAVCVAVKTLKNTGVRDDIDFVVVHLSISKYILRTMHNMNIITKRVKKLPYAHKHFEDCLTKFWIFQLTQYDRVVYLDADTYPIKNLDHLFTIPFKEKIAAPRAYWLPQPFVTSMLLVFKPSMEMWHRVKKYFPTALKKYLFDMDIINLEFKDEFYYLADEYGCLDSEWEDIDVPYHFGNPDESIQRIMIVHFSALGKPWFYRPDKLHKIRSKTHPIFFDLWGKWWLTRDQIIMQGSLISKLQYSFLKYISQKENLKWLRILKKRFIRLSQNYINRTNQKE